MTTPKPVILTPAQIEDAKFIGTTMKWPAWPLLPLKRANEGDRQCGLIVDAGRDPAHLSVVYLTNLFDPTGRTGNLRTDFVENAAITKLTYPSVADMLADGWQVD